MARIRRDEIERLTDYARLQALAGDLEALAAYARRRGDLLRARLYETPGTEAIERRAAEQALVTAAEVRL